MRATKVIRPRPSRRPAAGTRLDAQLRGIQRLVMQGELAATAVHEISNLQTIVLFNAGLLKEEHKGDAAVARHVEPLLHAAGLVAALCNQLRNLARPPEAHPQWLELNAVARRTHTLLQRIIPRDLLFEPDPGVTGSVIADPGQVEQMLINLVLNARDATPAEGGRIIVRVGATRGRRPFLEVEDNGTGMTPAVKARLFQKFFTTKAPGHGTGLGLVTVHRLLEGMGGRIEVRSRAGRGTRIRLVYPPAPAADPAGGAGLYPPNP
ncbi:Wide host range VirA protein [Lacunisphaera limnophila]|uniref:histidine kinase n=1 Tax=Lacunisphaera limnophila TaxID=1838286 RepID=A0A1D8AYE0_9BACT|nr:HAMP domain-containing sensor histidine kinase [Lacunisphaera limnophila]AOS45906.1 Wide host range VirA protein [Lacunisphaera limnophila]